MVFHISFITYRMYNLNGYLKFIIKFMRLMMKNRITLPIVILILIISYIFIPKTNVNYDMTMYLPSDSMTKEGMDILVDEFGEESTIQIMIMNIEPTDLLSLKASLIQVNNVDAVIWLDDYVDLNTVPIEYIDPTVLGAFYEDGNALITIVFDVNSYEVSLDDSINSLTDILGDYTIHMRGEPLLNSSTRQVADNEIIKIMLLLIPLILFLLFISSHAWIEPLLIVIALGFAAIFNLITNGLLPSVSFITMTMSLALQLALSIDYALFMIHRYYEERTDNNAKDASKLALKHSIRPITISALTTIAGFSALMLMRFTIGMDIALVLSKGILFSYLSTILILPILLIWFDPLITKTKHRVFFPNLKRIVKFQIKAKYFLLPLLLIILVLGFFIQRNTEYLFGQSSNANEDSTLNLDRDIINDAFGPHNQMVILIPNESVSQEVNLVTDLIANENILSVNALVTQVNPNIPRENLPAELTSYYIGEEYSRIIINTSIYEESEDLYEFSDSLKVIVSDNYDNFYIVGQASSLSDIKESIEDQGVWILLITILAVGLVVGMIFKSIKIPIILIGIILSAIWFNMSFLVIRDIQIIYIGYLIVMSIQLGATIDYAVLLTNRYLEERKTNNKEKAMTTAFTSSSISIIISGSILTIAGYVEGLFSKVDSVSRIGQLLGSGALISLIMILLFLPAMLLIFDKYIIKTKNKHIQ